MQVAGTVVCMGVEKICTVTKGAIQIAAGAQSSLESSRLVKRFAVKELSRNKIPFLKLAGVR